LRDPSTLTPEEVKLLKKRKRLIKNRESAQLSRQRKRLRLETLQAEVLHLEDENKALNSRVDQLMEENAALKRKLLGGSGGGSSAGKTRSSAAAAAAASVH
jgi:predicted  nucleic acid-binding Zn-ribbon protein